MRFLLNDRPCVFLAMFLSLISKWRLFTINFAIIFRAFSLQFDFFFFLLFLSICKIKTHQTTGKHLSFLDFAHIFSTFTWQNHLQQLICFTCYTLYLFQYSNSSYIPGLYATYATTLIVNF